MWWTKLKKRAHVEETVLLFSYLKAQGKEGAKPSRTENSNANSCLTHSYPTLLLSPVIFTPKPCSQPCHLLPREAAK